MSRIILALTGFILLVVGNIMPKIKRSYIIGARFPWAYKGPEAWRVTQNISRYVMVAAGS